MISGTQSTILIVLFSIILVAVVLLISRKSKSADHFLVGNRQFGLFTGAFTTAAAWLWAPALFVSSQTAYTKGLPGVFWFIVPNVLALVVFAFYAKKVRGVMEQGYTLPEYIKHRLGPKNQIIYYIVMLLYAIYAIMVQLTGSLLLLNFATDLPKPLLVAIIAVVFFSVASFRGIRSTVVADILKIAVMLFMVIIIAPAVIANSGGFTTIAGGIGGAKGTFTDLFDGSVAWTFGVPTAVSLLCGCIIEQQEWQRAFSIKKDNVKKSFLLGSVIFLVVPVMLSVLGFIASNPEVGISVENPQLSGIAVVAKYFPQIGVAIFIVMLLFALAAAGSSALCAISSIVTVDIYKQYFNKSPNEKQTLTTGRIAMLVILAIGAGVTLIPDISILYLMLLSGAFKAALFAPTLLALFWNKTSSKATFWSMIVGLLTGIPLFIYGSIVGNPNISSIGSLTPIVLGFIICYLGSINNKKESSLIKY